MEGLQSYHLTKDGTTTLCGVDGMKIHTTYADRILDCGQWCAPCQWNFHKLRPYRFSFTAEGVRQSWIRFYRDMEFGLEDSKRVALRENDDAHAFAIESDQDNIDIRKSWGLDF